MKLLFISSSFPRSSNKLSSSFSYEFCKSLYEKGIEVIVLAPHDHDSKFKEIINGIKVYRFPYFYPFSAEKLAYDAGIAYNFKNSILAKIQLPFFLISEFIYIIKIIKTKNVDVIVSFWLIPQGFVAAICNKILSVNHIAVIHSSEVTILKKLKYGPALTKFIFNNSTRIVSVSSHRAKELLSMLSSKSSRYAQAKMHIIPMGIDSSKIKNSENADELNKTYSLDGKFVVLFVGRLVEVKGCMYLIQAFRKVVDEVPEAKLIIVGSGYLEKELKELVKINLLEEYIHFVGFVSSDKISIYYSRADIVVVPSIVDIQNLL
jgi:glycosyltransferase involved in cell wall biosynthesis